MNTLCWQCKHASGSQACKWATKARPIEGWTADPSIIKYYWGNVNSFNVEECPQYEEGHEDAKLTESGYKALACAILNQAVSDWEALDYGETAQMRKGQDLIYSAELKDFFESSYCDELAFLAIEHSGEDICKALKVDTADIPDSDIVKKLNNLDREALWLLYKSGGKVMDAVKAGPFSVTTLYAQLKRVKRITQIDPYRSWGLGLLIKWLAEEEKANDRSRNESKTRPSI